jgi:hypothetical protein
MTTEEVERVTSDKPKNPGRQEWGKKLGKMQKELKVQKQNEQKIDSEIKAKSFLRWEYFVAAGGLIIGAAALYYQKKSYEIVKDDSSNAVESQNTTSINKQMKFSDF